MIFSRKKIAAIAVCAAITSASLAQANSVVLTQNSYSFDVAGEFSANTSQSFIGNYAQVARVGSYFETFCVESDVIFYPTMTYTYVLSSQDSLGRSLSEGAAFLYYEFATGQLAGYDYADPSVRVLDAGELQAAIWEFQDHQSFPGYPSFATDPFYLLATSTLGADAYDPANGQYGVDIIQLWDGTTQAQNQLVLVSLIPDTAATNGMLALACAGLVLFAWRFNRQKPVAVSVAKRS